MRSLLLVVAAGVVLTGCGGGGGGGGASTLPAVNNSQSAGSHASPSPSPSPKTSASSAASPPPASTPKASATPRASATPSPTAAPAGGTAPSHIPTWAYDETGGEGSGASALLVQNYLTYAEGSEGNDKAQSDCDGAGPSPCSSVFYFDPNFIYDAPSCTTRIAALFMAAASESWFVHETGYSDAAHRVRGSYQGSCNGSAITTPVYLTDQLNPAVDAFFTSYMQTYANNWDRYFMDDTSASVLTQAYGPGGGFCGNNPPDDYCTSTQEYPTDASVVTAHMALFAALNRTNGASMTGFFNGIGFTQAEYNLNLVSASNGRALGAACEECVVNAGTLEYTNYPRVLDAMATANATTGASFVELSTGYSPAGSAAQIGQRLVTTAMAWLGFNGSSPIVFPNLEDNTGDLAIWPEDGLYPERPLQSMNAGASDIAVASNVWRREFAACFLNGSPIGPCAAVVNGTASPATIASSWLTQTYGHVVTLVGGDIESGGSVALAQTAFTANATEVPAAGAVLLVR